MNQTQKRLSIINYAISITDVETIQLQVLKLAPLKADEKLQEILTAIHAGNYARAQRLITSYIETPPEEILQRTAQQAQASLDSQEQDIIDEFDLFVTSDIYRKPKEIDINDFFLDPFPAETKKEETKRETRIDYDALLNIEADQVLTDSDLTRDSADEEVDSFYDSSKEKSAQGMERNATPKEDTFFDTEETEETEAVTTPTSIEETLSILQKRTLTKSDPLQELKPLLNTVETEDISPYEAIPYIAQKLSNMQKEYPPVKETYEVFDSVEALLTKISREGYTEEEIIATLDTVKTLTETNDYAEAAELLLTCAATESMFAQFMLARELYRGVLLDQNIAEAFNRMYSLAMEDYPEALCDLAQFYEHGVGTEKDRKKAEQFYKEAMDLGIKRAEKHHARLKKQNRGLFGLKK
ncbi:MAG TPA: hypothetical protein VIM88_04680 [Sulfurovum sp.]|uniref:tetratricopeptide repeat protein n=1 Tax=Sulfurovum sp. TaxID=1969726 RepID=UPI002F94E230